MPPQLPIQSVRQTRVAELIGCLEGVVAYFRHSDCSPAAQKPSAQEHWKMQFVRRTPTPLEKGKRLRSPRVRWASAKLLRVILRDAICQWRERIENELGRQTPASKSSTTSKATTIPTESIRPSATKRPSNLKTKSTLQIKPQVVQKSVAS